MKKPILPVIILGIIIPATWIWLLFNLGFIGLLLIIPLTLSLAIIAGQRYLGNTEIDHGYLPKGSHIKAAAISLLIVAFWPAFFIIPEIIDDAYDAFRAIIVIITK